MILQNAIRWLYAGYTFEQEKEWKRLREDIRRGLNHDTN